MKKQHGITLDLFTLSYIEAMLWAELDDADEPLDKNHTAADIAPEALRSIVADCTKFQETNAAHIACEGSLGERHAGHDFWLTRNGHGAGFWDGDWPEEAGNAMSASAKAFGSSDVYVGDDGQLWVSPLVPEEVAP